MDPPLDGARGYEAWLHEAPAFRLDDDALAAPGGGAAANATRFTSCFLSEALSSRGACRNFLRQSASRPGWSQGRLLAERPPCNQPREAPCLQMNRTHQ